MDHRHYSKATTCYDEAKEQDSLVLSTIEDFSKVCRTCLHEEGPLECIFENPRLCEMIQDLTFIRISGKDKEEGLSMSVCTKCISEIRRSYYFKKTCESNETTLRDALRQITTSTNIEIKYEEDGENCHKNDCEEILDAMNIVKDECLEFGEAEDCEEFEVKDCKKFEVVEENVKRKATDAKKRVKGSANICCGCGLDLSGHVNEEEGFCCCLCEKDFEKFISLKRHMNRHKTDNCHTCQTCGKSFVTPYEFKIHIRIHTGEKPFTCNTCGKNFSDPRVLNQHAKTHTGVKPYECKICNKSFRLAVSLRMHQRVHTLERPYVCSMCGKTFVYATNLVIHTRSQHTGERPFGCKLCSKRFSSSSTLASHAITHTGERRYICSVCGKRLARSGELGRHMRTHTGEKPYACSLCPNRYYMSCHLNSHIASAHKGEKHVCETCGKGFTRARALKKHLQVHTEANSSMDVVQSKNEEIVLVDETLTNDAQVNLL